MKIKEIGIDELELGDERFRISYFFSLDSLIRSIKEVGLVNPPVVTARSGRLLIVAGWKRALACRELSLSPLPVFLLEEADDLKAFRMSFFENLTMRRFSLLEKSEIIRKLFGLGEGEKKIIKTYLPLLAIPPTYDYYTLFMNISSLKPEEKELIHKKNVPLAALQRLVEFTPEDRSPLYPLLLPLGQNKQKDLLFRSSACQEDYPLKKFWKTENSGLFSFPATCRLSRRRIKSVSFSIRNAFPCFQPGRKLLSRPKRNWPGPKTSRFLLLLFMKTRRCLLNSAFSLKKIF